MSVHLFEFWMWKSPNFQSHEKKSQSVNWVNSLWTAAKWVQHLIVNFHTTWDFIWHLLVWTGSSSHVSTLLPHITLVALSSNSHSLIASDPLLHQTCMCAPTQLAPLTSVLSCVSKQPPQLRIFASLWCQFGLFTATWFGPNVDPCIILSCAFPLNSSKSDTEIFTLATSWVSWATRAMTTPLFIQVTEIGATKIFLTVEDFKTWQNNSWQSLLIRTTTFLPFPSQWC